MAHHGDDRACVTDYVEVRIKFAAHAVYVEQLLEERYERVVKCATVPGRDPKDASNRCTQVEAGQGGVKVSGQKGLRLLYECRCVDPIIVDHPEQG